MKTKLSLLAAVITCSTALAELKPAKIFGSNMVLQQEKPIKIWGTGDNREPVAVTFAGKTVKTHVSENGKWEVNFPPRKASFDQLTLKINEKSFSNILIGEVWICSGQSNMAFALGKVTGGKNLAVENSNLRLCHNSSLPNVAKKGYSAEQLKRCNTDSFYQPNWSPSSKKSAMSFSGVGWIFANNLQKELNIPVGVIHVSMGGSAMDSWLPASIARKHPMTKGLYEGDWLKNDYAPEAHRKRGSDAFKKILKKGEPYRIGQLKGHRWMCEPDFLFESGIAPLKGLNFKGVLWYQGEAETQSEVRLENAKTVLPLLINSWRDYFAIGDFPFLLVQLPGFNRTTWPEFRETQRQTAKKVANTAMVVTIDTGDKKNIHPKDKISIGERSGALALNMCYGKKSGKSPEVNQIKATGKTVTLSFKNCDKGFKSVNGNINGFEIAGKDGKFVKATAELTDAKTITLKSSVTNPTSVRYAWQPYPNPKLVVYTKENLPLGPFLEKITK